MVGYYYRHMDIVDQKVRKRHPQTETKKIPF